jgi:hypothetical protein
MKKLLLLAALAVSLAACADMTPTQQRALTGTAAGAGVGAVFGAIGAERRARCGRRRRRRAGRRLSRRSLPAGPGQRLPARFRGRTTEPVRGHLPAAVRDMPSGLSPASSRGSRIAYFSAISNFRRSKPSDGRSIASDLATNASGEVHAEVAGGPRDVAVVLADGYMMGVHRRARAPREHDVRELPERVLKERRAGPIHHRADRS